MESKNQFEDRMKCKANPEVLAQLGVELGEQIIFSCLVVKINRWGLRQDRTLLVTNQSLYNIKKSQVQRKIALPSVQALTKCLCPGEWQFVIHVRNEYDYLYMSEHRQDIFKAIKFAFHQFSGKNVPVYGVPENLKAYHTSKKDIQQGLEVVPQEIYRMYKEDIYKVTRKKLPPVMQTPKAKRANLESLETQDTQRSKSEGRKKQSLKSFVVSKYKGAKQPEIQDFKIKVLLGKGSFGKVFLVQREGQTYAMKTIRKDLLLEKTLVESCLVEKEILMKS